MISPEQAAIWLRKNSNNRHLRPQTIAKFARDMKSGNWVFNGETIKFSKSGRLLDGQHRLYACINANAPFESLVAFNLPEEAQDTVDTGNKRTTADVLRLGGESHALVLSSALTWVWRKVNDKLQDRQAWPSVTEAQEILLLHPEVKNYIPLAERIKKEFRVQTGMVAMLYWWLAQIDEEAADEFFQRLLVGDKLSEGHPILALRSRLINVALNRTRGSGKLDQVTIMVYMIKAWNAVRQRKDLKLLRWNYDEPFPEPV